MRLVWVVIPLIFFGIIGISESFARGPGPYYSILLTDAEGNLSYSIPLGKEGFFEFHSAGFDNQGRPLEATISIVCGPNNVVQYNETKLLIISSSRTIMNSFVPTFSGHYTITMMAEGIPTIATTFTIPGNSENHCDSEFIKNLSPLKQIKHGIESTGVACKEGLELIFKPSDNSPACVKPETAEKLMERGWTSPIIENSNKAHLDIELDPILYSGGPVSSKMIETPRVTDSSITVEEISFPSDSELIISKFPRVGDTIDVTFNTTYKTIYPHQTIGQVEYTVSDGMEFVSIPDDYELEYREPQSSWGKYYPGLYILTSPFFDFESDIPQTFTIQVKTLAEGINGIRAEVQGEGSGIGFVIGSQETLLTSDYYLKYPDERPEKISIDLPTTPQEQAAFEKKYGVSFGTTTIKTNITEEEHRIWLENYGMSEDEIKEALERIFG